MNLDWLSTLITIVDRKSLTGAAQELKISQPAVSKQLRALEAFYGTPLLNRRGREPELTEAGKVVYRHGQRILQMIEKSVNEARKLADTVQGELVLGAGTIPGEYILPRLLGAFQQQYPAVRVSLEISGSKEVARRVQAGEFAAGVIGLHVGAQNLKHELVYNDELVVVVPREHRFAGRDIIALEEFCSEQIVSRESESGTRAVIEKKLQECGVDPATLNNRIELGSTDAVLNAVTEGLGISLVSILAAQPRIRAGTLAAVRISGFPNMRGLYLITRKNRVPDHLLTTFIDFVKQSLAQDAGKDAG
jgi:DNA-binding transcriptional LysR family regulator